MRVLPKQKLKNFSHLQKTQINNLLSQKNKKKINKEIKKLLGIIIIKTYEGV